MYLSCPLITRERTIGGTTNTVNFTFMRDTSTLLGNYSTEYLSGPHSSIVDEIVDRASLPPGACSLKDNKLMFKEVTNRSTTIDSLDPMVDNYARYNKVTSPTHTYEWFIHDGYIMSIIDETFLSTTWDFVSESEIKAALEKLQPSFKDAKVNQFNVYTAVLELADLKKTFSKTAYKLGKSVTRNVAEKNLLVNFGILPLWGDITTIYDIMTRLTGYIDRWNDAAKNGVIWDKHITVSDITGSVAASDSLVCSDFPGSVFDWWASSPSRNFTATTKVHMYYRPKPISDADRNKVFKRALGLDKPLAGVWEAVPFSWAVDYFINIGEIIDAYDEAIETMFQYEFISAGYSVKSSIEGSFNFYPVWKAPSGYSVTTYPASIDREIKSESFVRRRLPLASMFEYMSKPDPLVFQNKVGYRQASYLASVAYLRGKR